MRNTVLAKVLAVVLCAGLAWCAEAGEDGASVEGMAKEETLKVGDLAPNVKLVKTDDEGEKKTVELKSFRGKKNVLLAFYPKTFTSGCTKQMCGYRDDFSRFKNADTDVFAISVEHQEASDRFKKEYELPFSVVGDNERKLVKAFKVPVRDSQGNTYAKRSVFLVDKQGVIRHMDLNYDIEKDKQSLYDRISALNKSEGS